jgi:hypothetical protein
MKLSTCSALLIIMMASGALAQDLATTQDGRVILLKADGTWQLVGRIPAKDARPEAAKKEEALPSSGVLNLTDPADKKTDAVSPSDKPTGATTATGKTIYEGPRGGHYHYSASGKKVYERKRR